MICYLVFILITVLISLIRMASPFPDTLEGFGYAFNSEGQLRKIDPETQQPGNESFEFNVSPEQSYNQKDYEALGEVLTEHIYKLLETTCGLKRLVLPKDGSTENSSFIFASSDAFTNPDKLLILIHGSGVVRAGQWARSLVINDSLKVGTQISAIEHAKQLGYAILVLNTNDNERDLQRIKGSGEPEEHAASAWEDYVRSAPARHIAIMAHSYGGYCTITLAKQFRAEFQDRVFAIAFSDSVHFFKEQDYSNGIVTLLQKVGCNWVTSDKPLDTPVIRSKLSPPDITRLSAGHTDHAMTTHSSHESAFRFIEQRYKSLECPKKQIDEASVEASQGDGESYIDASAQLRTGGSKILEKEL